MTTRTTLSVEQSLAKQARELGVNVSAAARQGVASAVRAALAKNDTVSRMNDTPRDPILSGPKQSLEFWWNRGQTWFARVEPRRRPVLVLTRDEVLAVRTLVTVAEVTTTMRGLAAEVVIDHDPAGLDQESAINCDGLHTVPQSMLTEKVGRLDGSDLERVCAAVSYALGC